MVLTEKHHKSAKLPWSVGNLSLGCYHFKRFGHHAYHDDHDDHDNNHTLFGCGRPSCLGRTDGSDQHNCGNSPHSICLSDTIFIIGWIRANSGFWLKLNCESDLHFSDTFHRILYLMTFIISSCGGYPTNAAMLLVWAFCAMHIILIVCIAWSVKCQVPSSSTIYFSFRCSLNGNMELCVRWKGDKVGRELKLKQPSHLTL